MWIQCNIAYHTSNVLTVSFSLFVIIRTDDLVCVVVDARLNHFRLLLFCFVRLDHFIIRVFFSVIVVRLDYFIDVVDAKLDKHKTSFDPSLADKSYFAFACFLIEMFIMVTCFNV